MAAWRGRERVGQILKRLPPAQKAAANAQLDVEAPKLVGAIQAACPVGVDLEREPGQLRDSVHEYDAGEREGLKKKRILADARDAKGEFIGPHVEWGHRGRDGGHVPPVPFFFTTWRTLKRWIKSRMSAATRAPAKAAAAQLRKGG